MDKEKNNPFSVRGSISKFFSMFNFTSKKSVKDIVQKENKSNTSLEHVINKYTEYTIDDYLIHSKIFLEYDNVEALIIVLRECILMSFIFEEEINKIINNPIFSKIEFTQIYNFDLLVNVGGLNSIIIYYFENNISNKNQSKLNFNFSKDSFLIHHFLKKYFILTWQKKFENSIIKDCSEIYQYHFYVKKINNRGKPQDRILMISNKFIYNIKSKYNNNSFQLKNAKWSDAIIAITKLNIFVEKDFYLRLNLDKNLNREENLGEKKTDNSISMKEVRDFVFISECDFNYFLFLMKRIYYNLTIRQIVVEIEKLNDV